MQVNPKNGHWIRVQLGSGFGPLGPILMADHDLGQIGQPDDSPMRCSLNPHISSTEPDGQALLGTMPPVVVILPTHLQLALANLVLATWR